MQSRMLQYLLLALFPAIQNVIQMHGEKVGGRGEAWSERWTSGVNLKAWYIILYNYRYYIGFLTVHFWQIVEAKSYAMGCLVKQRPSS